MYKHEFWFRESWTNKACLIVYNLAKSPDIISEADNNNTSMMHTWNQIFSKCHLPWGTNFQKDYWYHETTSTNLICVYQPNFMTGIVDIRCLAPGKRVSKYSQWVWKQLHKNKRNHECINCPLFGHRNKSRWRYHGGDIRDVLIFISHNNPKFPGLEQKKNVQVDFALLDPEHSTSVGKFRSSQVLLESEEYWICGWRIGDMWLFILHSAMATGHKGFHTQFQWRVSAFVFSM